jgi:hypothetical protein
VRSPVLLLLPVEGGSVSTLEDQIHDGDMDKTVLNDLAEKHGVAR